MSSPKEPWEKVQVACEKFYHWGTMEPVGFQSRMTFRPHCNPSTVRARHVIEYTYPACPECQELDNYHPGG
jgi:hypothetical protein